MELILFMEIPHKNHDENSIENCFVIVFSYRFEIIKRNQFYSKSNVEKLSFYKRGREKKKNYNLTILVYSTRVFFINKKNILKSFKWEMQRF